MPKKSDTLLSFAKKEQKNDVICFNKGFKIKSEIFKDEDKKFVKIFITLIDEKNGETMFFSTMRLQYHPTLKENI